MPFLNFCNLASVQSNKSKIQTTKKTRRALMLASAALACASQLQTGHAAEISATFTDGATTHFWSNPGNWSSAAEPNNGNGGNNYIVTIPSAPRQATLDTTVTVDGLNVASSSTLNLQDNTSLTLTSTATTVTNNGLIVINSNQAAAAAILTFNGTTLLTGTGTIQMNLGTTNAQLNTGAGAALTQDTNHSITGFGDINAALTNNGTVNANVANQTLFLQTNNMTNNATFETTVGSASLAISGITVTQGSAGKISAATSSSVFLEGGATVSGGTLTSTGSGAISISGTDTITSITNSGTINIPDNNTLNVSGTLSDTGQIVVNSNSAGATTILNFNTVTVSGAGSIVLNDNGTNAELNGTLTQSATHIISGYGQINAALNNSGTVDATVANQTLILQTNAMTNHATFEATTSGATLAISGITVTQVGNGNISAATGSTVLLESSATISGGTLTSAGTGSITINNTDTISGVTNSGTINIPDGGTLDVTGNLSDTGEILVNSNVQSASAILSFSGGTVSGAGSIVLNNSSTNAQLNGTLTQSSGHTISGEGVINATLTNNGTVDANTVNQALIIQPASMTNTATMEATSGATLQFTSAVAVTNTGGQITANGGTVQFDHGAAVTGGTLSAVHPSVILVPQSSNNITLGYAASFTGLTISSGTEVDLQDNSTLAATGPTFTDNGTVVINSNQQGAPSILVFSGTTLLTGSGTVELNYFATNAQLNTTTGGALTQDTNHTIDGFGQINAAITNNGTVNANSINQALVLQTNSMTNNATFEATAGGSTLAINGITVTQGTNGKISAATGTTVELEGGATVSSGTLATTGTGIFTISGTDTISGATSSAMIDIPEPATLNVTGNLTNTGEILVNSNVQGAATVISFNGGTVSGAGSIVLNDTTSNAQLNGTLTQSAGHTISGEGQINAALTSSGTVNANATNQTLTLQTNNMTNKANFEAAGSGSTLAINAITVTQVGNGNISATNSNTIELEGGATVSGGSIIATGNGNVVISGTDTLTNVTNSAPINIPEPSTLNVTGTLSNSAQILVNSNAQGAPAVINFTSATLSGTGSIVLNNSTTNAQLNGTLTQSAGHTISGFGQINAALTNNGLVSANVANQTLVLNHAITGTGTLNIGPNSFVSLAIGTGGSTQGSLAIASNGQLDLTNNHLFINYGSGPDPIASIAAWIKSGYNSGAWNGNGIVSSNARNNAASYGIGYADFADPGNPAGLSSGQIEIKYTLLGDANLDGKVNGSDFAILATNFNKAVTGWDQADFNYDGKDNGADFTFLAASFNQGASQSAVDVAALDSFAAANGLSADVPEAGTATLAGVCLASLLARRRRGLSTH